jgi:hypothetical protein
MPAVPNMIGTIVRQLSQGYCAPPHVTPMRKLHVLEMNRNAPTQSVFMSRSLRTARFALSRTTKGTIARPMAQKGKSNGEGTKLVQVLKV